MNVFIIAAISLDGFIAEKVDQTSTDWTSKEDKKFFAERTRQAKAMVFGSTTFKTIGHPLKDRLNIVYSKNPSQFGLGGNKYDTSQLRFTQASPAELITQLEKEGFTELAVCGGASIYNMFLRSGVVNKLYITIEPTLFGQGIKLIDSQIGGEMLTRLKLVSQKNLSNQTLLLEYDVASS